MLSSEELPHESVQPVSEPLDYRQLWEGAYRSGSNFNRFAVHGRNPMRRVEPYGERSQVLLRYVTGQKFQDRDAKRQFITYAVTFGFARHLDYEGALDEVDMLQWYLGELNIGEHTIALQGIHQQIVARRDQSYAEQVMQLNEYIQEDPESLTVLLMRNDNSPGVPLYTFADLQGFCIADDGSEAGPKPDLVLSGKDGVHGSVPGPYHPRGLYVEYSQEHAAAESAAWRGIGRATS